MIMFIPVVLVLVLLMILLSKGETGSKVDFTIPVGVVQCGMCL
jgi:hypothetical protein